MNKFDIFKALVKLKGMGYSFSITHSGWKVSIEDVVIREAHALVPTKSLVIAHAHAAMVAAEDDAKKRFPLT